MEQIHAPQTIPHLIQVYQQSTTTKIQNPQIIHISHPPLQTSQGKVTYQETITSESIHIPVTAQEIGNEQIVLSCQQHIHNVPLQGQISTQVVQGSDIGQSLHVLLPQVPIFKQHMFVNGVQQHYFEQYEFPKEHCVLTTVDAEIELLNEEDIECKTEKQLHPEKGLQIKKRTRNQTPNPSMWVSNIRKLKHQRGEAYINRRGKYIPERHIKNTKDCLRTCKFKCSEQINDSDREHIFKAFYSLNANEKKHFLLNTTERNNVKHVTFSNSQRRKFSFKYFFLVRAVKYTVCKNFYLGTLAISQKPIYNVHSGKSDMNIPKPDGRGQSEASIHKVKYELKEGVRNHIMSYKTINSKPIEEFSSRKQYLDSSLTIRQMYTSYYNQCSKDNITPVKEHMYRKIFKREFNLHFRKRKDQLCSKCKHVIKKN